MLPGVVLVVVFHLSTSAIDLVFLTKILNYVLDVCWFLFHYFCWIKLCLCVSLFVCWKRKIHGLIDPRLLNSKSKSWTMNGFQIASLFHVDLDWEENKPQLIRSCVTLCELCSFCCSYRAINFHIFPAIGNPGKKSSSNIQTESFLSCWMNILYQTKMCSSSVRF